MSQDSLKALWEASYGRRENFVFYPDPQLIRFFARNLRKQVGDNEFVDVMAFSRPPRLLDLCCGIGRNMMVGQAFQFEMAGLDLSETATNEARARLTRAGFEDAASRVVAGSADNLPWPDGYFDCVISDSALDSMPYEVARNAILQAYRVLRDQGLLWFNVLANGPDWFHDDDCDEIVVSGAHEHGTVQGFFSKAKIERLLGQEFSVQTMESQELKNIDGEVIVSRIYVTAFRN